MRQNLFVSLAVTFEIWECMEDIRYSENILNSVKDKNNPAFMLASLGKQEAETFLNEVFVLPMVAVA
jgi:hypothetical protein